MWFVRYVIRFNSYKCYIWKPYLIYAIQFIYVKIFVLKIHVHKNKKHINVIETNEDGRWRPAGVVVWQLVRVEFGRLLGSEAATAAAILRTDKKLKYRNSMWSLKDCCLRENIICHAENVFCAVSKPETKLYLFKWLI